ncbi:MAG: ferredoxin [Salinibacterium amurskyense]
MDSARRRAEQAGGLIVKIVADTSLCQGYANCMVAAPDFFDIDDDGKVSVLESSPEDADQPLVEDAVASCPVRALRLEATS